MRPRFLSSTHICWTAAALIAVPSLLLCQSSTPTEQSTKTVASAQVPAPPIPTSDVQATPEELGDAFMAHQRYQAAIQAYESAPRKSAELWNKLGIAYQLMFNNQDAARCYKKALKLNPKDANVFNNIGSVDMELKLYHAAVHAYRRAIKLNPESALFHKNLGTAYLAQRDYKKGWRAYQAALTLDPTVFSHAAGMRVQNPASLTDRGAMNYYMAKSCAQAGLDLQAVEYLRMALNEGFTHPKKVLDDPEFARLKTVPAFQQLMASQGIYLTSLSAHPSVRQ